MGGPDRHRGGDAPDGKTKKQLDSELVWLITMYVLYVWDTVHVKNAEVKIEQFFGFLTFKFKEHDLISSVKIDNLPIFR